MTDLGSDEKTGVVRISDSTVQQNLQTLSSLVDALVPKYAKIDATENLCELVDREMSNTANAIEAAAGRLVRLKGKPRESYSGYELRIHDCILEASLGITNSIGELIKAATDAQNQIVREGKGTQSRTAFYKRNNRWTEGFISAAKAIATSTNVLIETADGVVSVRNSMEQLIVASNDVAASTAQLVAASRVKASYMSNKQSLLEDASRTVSMACRGLVRQVKNYLEEETKSEGAALDYASLSAHDLKVREMEQQVEILQLENSLAKARMSLGELRKISYRDD
ncbi:sla2 Src-like adaptor 2 [Ascosphaera atra]|nr:sla2 Src-like adaptor 2 [Ascosphaera atra]